MEENEIKKPILEVSHLSVGFLSHGKKVNVIRNISLDVYQGETLAIVGESGSGKSVFTKTFTGMLDANGYISDGHIMFDGMDLTTLKTTKDWKGIRGKRIAMIFQDPMTSLNPLFSIGYQIEEVLMLHHGLSRKEAKQEAIRLLGKVRIPNPEERIKDYPFQYSGGMRQRVVIAIALACRPEILICDEPTTALDVTVQSQILDLIKELQKEYHWTTIFITHDLGVVANVADRIAVMYGGQIIEYGTAEDIFYRPAHPYTWALLSSLPQLGTKDEPLVYIKGNPPSFVGEIVGDAFATRNDYALRIDFLEEPPIFKISDTHYAKTWLLDPRAPKVEKPLIIQNLRERMKAAAEVLKREVGDLNESK
jgi:oligopeptide transport system ATP-binding protein